MKLFIFIALIFTSLSATAKIASSNQTTVIRCSTADVEPLDRIIVENELNVHRAKRNFAPINMRDIKKVRVPTYIHVLASDKTEAGGNVSDDKLKKQMAYLNDAYKKVNIVFELQKVTRTIDKTWATLEAGEEVVKEQLREGGAESLNLYVAGVPGGVLGWAYFPWDYALYPHNDGVVIHFETLPGGALKEYNEGGTAVHEVGHWLGLYHVFQGGCADGDHVEDTPPQQKPNFGCPIKGADSCGKGLEDSIHNFMDYSDDVCLEDFSTGQIHRVHDNLASYRQ